jgi:hypothetical protein
MILPRQARDKHRETQKLDRFVACRQTVEQELGCPLEQVFESFEVRTHN